MDSRLTQISIVYLLFPDEKTDTETTGVVDTIDTMGIVDNTEMTGTADAIETTEIVDDTETMGIVDGTEMNDTEERRKVRGKKKEAADKIRQMISNDQVGMDSDGDDDFESKDIDMEGGEKENEDTAGGETEKDVDRKWVIADLIEFPDPKSRMKNRYCIACDDNRVWRSYISLRDHFRSVHCGLTYDCSMCDPIRAYQNERDWRDHVDKCHVNTLDYMYDCNVLGCNNTFKTQGALDRHVALHHPSNRFQCETCKKDYATKYLLERHPCNSIEYVCRMCDKTFKTKDGFNRHRLYTHNKTKTFDCVKCGKSYQSPQARSYHVKRCAGAEPAEDDEN